MEEAEVTKEAKVKEEKEEAAAVSLACLKKKEKTYLKRAAKVHIVAEGMTK
jgi:hypothetical protein